MRFMIILILLFMPLVQAIGSDPTEAPPWNPDAGTEGRCHVFDQDAEVALAWFAAHPASLDSWIQDVQSLCFTDRVAQSEFQRSFLKELYSEFRAKILDNVQPYQQHPDYGATASRIVDAVQSVDVPYR